ncbi:MAG: DUF1501 domain-containing protein [Actinobacteria bacterium]|nr:DUF1501 domain-containing protein [Actinomycetota bacterium]MCB8996700.1 DUF1501 domain-containing protein [Actinomycetota bacterium]MCB9415111.1 DUF1501 domain-containing protein [Actinomycetota bacterium]MCB9425298.1 DUF1501 domain-containing protein [Actinomycetota bacterium]
MNACPECLSADISRRSLLLSLGVLGATAIGAGTARVAWAEGPWKGDTLVVLSLRGGFDGLSAVAPVGDPYYADLRPTIAVPVAAALPLDTTFGLHPAMSALKEQWDLGRVAAVNATGLPNPNRSHFSAMDEVERAAPGSGIRTGWLDRMLSLHDPSGPFGAVQLGSTSMPMAFAGPRDELGMDRLADFVLDGASQEADRARWSSALTLLHDRAGGALKTSAQVTLAALETASELADYDPVVPYPDSDLGRTLQDVAQLIKADVGARVITLDEGDWDMHADLGRVEGGWMADKLTDLSGSLAAFLEDLGPAREQVTLITISEFGRRAQENESAGVDHGWGNVMFVAGGNVNPGLHGQWPGLSPGNLDDGDLRATTDYRAVFADVLANRCGADDAAVGAVFPGWSGDTLGVTAP